MTGPLETLNTRPDEHGRPHTERQESALAVPGVVLALADGVASVAHPSREAIADPMLDIEDG